MADNTIAAAGALLQHACHKAAHDAGWWHASAAADLRAFIRSGYKTPMEAVGAIAEKMAFSAQRAFNNAYLWGKPQL